MPQRSARFIVVLLILLIMFAGPSLIRFYTDWLWFGEVGYQSVFTTMLRSQGTLFTIAFVAAFVWLALNFRLAVSSIGDLRPVFITREGIEMALPNRRQLRMLTTAVAMVVAILIGLFAAGRWELWMAWRNAVPFGQADPLLGRDVGFYVFTLPFVQFVRGLGQGLIVLAALGAGAVYFISGSMRPGFPVSFSMSSAARRHLSLLAGAFLLLLALGAWLQRAEFLIPSGATLAGGAGYADVHGRMPATLVLMAAAIIGAALAAVQAFTARNWPIPAAVGLYMVVSIGGEVYGTLLQRFVVSPNEQAREAPYIQNNIEATRRAFALDTIEERPISGDAVLTRQDIERNAATLQNVRLWDHAPLLETFSQIQEIRTYYDFASIDNDRYQINGALRQVMLSGRELNSTSLPNRTWVNERLTFTHGYGLTLGPVNQVTSQGLPVLFVRDLPPVTTAGLDVQEPSIYFGELSNDYVIVRTDAPEFHYPRGEKNEETRYMGSGGVALGSLWRKLLFALRFASYQIVLNDGIGPESRILFNRRIADRVRMIAGDFLRFDLDPYLVLADGRLHWIYDAYTTSSRYPYSTHAADGSNYWRNSVKFVIDAYHGTVTAYLADERDPIAATYARIFPRLFTPIAQMPAALREHVRYPEDIFAVQSQMYATYHMTQAAVFYNREDQWEIPTLDESSDGGASTMQPYYTIMRLPGEESAEFIQMLPFTPRRRDNLAAWLVARSDGEHYGRLRVFEFPKQKLVYGPRQVVARISQDQTISPQITLWNQQGSQVIWGTLMVIPIEESLIYVRPLYLRAQGGKIPELTRVIVAYEDRIVMAGTLDESLSRLFDRPAAAPPPGSEGESSRAPESPADQPAPGAAPAADAPTGALAAQARTHYDRAIAAQRAGDWARYGEEIRLLGEVLNRLRTQ
jgi:uncharacterized membrane protein (UPF0182 family)